MKTDRELLEWAAKAIGAEYRDHALGGQYLAFAPDWNGRRWNPLTDDGDALRLAAKLGISLTADEGIEVGTYEYAPGRLQGEYEMGVEAWIVTMTAPPVTIKAQEVYGQDRGAATRRAIVRAAAAIGEQP